MTKKLKINSRLAYSHRNDNAIVWYEDGDDGAVVGQSGADVAAIEAVFAADTDRYELETRTYYAVEIAVAKFVYSQSCDFAYLRSDGWRFETTSGLKAAMAVARGALATELAKAQAELDNKPWPEWATTAAANGWKAPKGWTP